MGLVHRLLRFGPVRRRYETRRPNHARPVGPLGDRAGLSVVVVAHNEGQLLRGCLENVQSVATEIIVVDAESTDDTAAVAREYTEHVIPTANLLMVEASKNVGIEAASCEWLLIIDPDERLSAQLKRGLGALLSETSPYDALFVTRRNYELGHWIRALGHYPGMQLRVVRRGRGSYGEERLHQHLEVSGPTGLLDGDLLHFPPQRVWDYAQKRNLYSEHTARALHDRGVPFRVRALVVDPLREFGRQYILLGGWLEGVAGFVIAAHGGWAKFLTQAKLWQLEAEARGNPLLSSSYDEELGPDRRVPHSGVRPTNSQRAAATAPSPDTVESGD